MYGFITSADVYSPRLCILDELFVAAVVKWSLLGVRSNSGL